MIEAAFGVGQPDDRQRDLVGAVAPDAAAMAGRSQGAKRQYQDGSRFVAAKCANHPASLKADCRSHRDNFGCHPGIR